MQERNPEYNDKADAEHHFGYDVLGPIVHRWLLGLEQYRDFFDDGQTEFLYCARAGVRIKELYDIYAEGRGRAPSENDHMFWISRLALCKGLYRHRPDSSASIIANEYPHQPIRSLLRGVFRNAPEWLARCDLTSLDLDAHTPNFAGWLKSDFEAARVVNEYLNASSDAFDKDLGRILGNSKRAVLIDSGWQGTGQSLLHHGRPDREWLGLYVGRILTPNHDQAITDKVIGLLFQADTFIPEIPESAISLHRHLFESLLEPNGPSIEEIVGGPCDSVAKKQIQENLEAKVLPGHDRHYILVREYLKDHAGLGPAEIIARHQKAAPELARMLSMPTREEALAVTCKDRSADFGKDLNVPVLITDTEADDLPPQYADRDSRIQHSLWPQGQIALEFTGKLRTELQLRTSGLSDVASYFDSAAARKSAKAEEKATLPKRPLVAVITRTKNRPLLLKRAAESLASQTYDNYLWVIVNDGGDEDAVRDVIAGCAVDRRKIRLVSNASSLGMEAASNAGIRHVKSDYVLIHDDDDSLHSDFLKKTVTYLESPGGKRYGGVVTGSTYVSEEIRGDEVIEHSRAPFMDWVRNIQLSELMAQNLFAPIAFIYRRKIYDEIGGYNPDLPVLGDWYFNLEFVLRADIKVMNETLAYYHHRDRGDSSRSGVYANSVIGGQSKHEEYASVFRNAFLRKYAQNNAVAAAMATGYFVSDLRGRLDNMDNRFAINTSGNANAHELTEAKEAALQAECDKRTRLAYDEIDRLWLLSLVLRHQITLAEQGKKWRSRKKTLALCPPDESIEALLSKLRERGVELAPAPDFDEEKYLSVNSDVAEACSTQFFRSGYQHYLLHGRSEGRERTTK